MRYEAKADIGAVNEDFRELQEGAQDAPYRLYSLLDDAAEDFRTLSADVKVTARAAARRLATLIRVG